MRKLHLLTWFSVPPRTEVGGVSSIKKWIQVVIAPFILILASGCSLFSKTGEQNRKQFQVRTAWVFQGPKERNEGFRKVNRFQPLVFTHQGKSFVVYGNALDGLQALSLDLGREKWRIQVPFGVEASAQPLGEHLYVGGLDGSVASYWLGSGTQQWKFSVASEILSEPLVTEDKVFILSGANTLYALDRSKGESIWVHTRQDTGSSSIRAGSKPLLTKDGNLVVGFSEGTVAAFNPATGAVIWEKQLNRGVKFRDMDSDPVEDGEQIFVSGIDDAVYSLKSKTGETNWKYEGGGWGRPLVLGDKLYFSGSTGDITCLEKSSGKKIWSYTLKTGVATSPVKVQNLIAFGESQGSIVFLDPESGSKITEFDPGRGILSTPAVDESGTRIFFISGEGNLYHLEVGWKRPHAFAWLK